MKSLSTIQDLFIVYIVLDGHVFEQCQQLEKMSHRTKLDFLKDKGLCFAMNTVKRKVFDKRITCKYCSQKHLGILHIRQMEKVEQKDLEQASKVCKPSSTCGHTGAGHSKGFLPILPTCASEKFKGN